MYQAGAGGFLGMALKCREARQVVGKLLLALVKKIIPARGWIVEKKMW